jgi:putative chitinase
MLLTKEMLGLIYPDGPKTSFEYYIDGLNEALTKGEINTVNRCACFLGQIGHESNQLNLLREVWDGKGQQAKYERDFNHAWPFTATDDVNKLAYMLGNSEKGDGFLFRGWGPLGVTGRMNTTKAIESMPEVVRGIDEIVAQPNLLDEPSIGFKGAEWYWTKHKLNALADDYNLSLLTKNINGACTDGYPSFYPKRVRLTTTARDVLARYAILA